MYREEYRSEYPVDKHGNPHAYSTHFKTEREQIAAADTERPHGEYRDDKREPNVVCRAEAVRKSERQRPYRSRKSIMKKRKLKRYGICLSA